MQHLAVLLAVVLGASAAQAVVLSPGDIITLEFHRVMRVDPVTGDRTTVSCSNPSTSFCPGGVVGGGFPLLGPTAIAYESSGSLIVTSHEFSNALVIRVDPATGDRQVVSSASVGTGDSFAVVDALAVVPPTSTSAVSVLPSWGLALIVGISIGAWLQMRRTREPKTT